MPDRTPSAPPPPTPGAPDHGTTVGSGSSGSAEDRFCSAAAVHAGEPLAGTAPARRTWLLVEHPGPWGREVLADAPWPADLRDALARQVDASGVRLLAVRRHDARPVGGPAPRPFVALARTGPDGWAVSRYLDSPDGLRDLPLADLAQGRRPDPASGWTDAGPLWGVCTQGQRDACCARVGRPVAEALSALDPEHTWEISHSGGHRFAPVVLAWPEGLAYGRVPPERLGELTTARQAGHVVPDLLRGQVHLTEPEQAADVALRAHLGLTALDAVRPVPAPADGAAQDPAGADRDGAHRVPTWWSVQGRPWRVDVRRVPLPDRPASCGKAPEPASAWVCDTPVPG